MNAAHALARTMLLMRSNLRADVDDALLLDALTSVNVEFVADERNLASEEGQHALVSAILLIARSGSRCLLRAPNVKLKGVHAPLTELSLIDALLDVGQDLIPGQEIEVESSVAAHIAVVLGDSPYSGAAKHIVRMSGDAWAGSIELAGRRWEAVGSPFGALAAAGLAAAEAYKFAMRRLRHLAARGPFEEYFRESAHASIALAPPGTPVPGQVLGSFDTVSAGAIIQSALYALSRIPGVAGRARVIEQDTNDLSNINRYALLRRSGVRPGTQKARYLSALNLGGLEIEPIPLRYEGTNRASIGALAPSVLVGVDNIDSRWDVQEEHPEWLGIGATEDYLAFLTHHRRGLPCARCVHPGGQPPNGPIPTVAFVSYWGGLALAAAFARSRSGDNLRAEEQVTQLACLQLGSSGAAWTMRGMVSGECPNECRLPIQEVGTKIAGLASHHAT